MEPQDKIIVEASKLLFHYGFKSFTMESLAKQLGMSKRTLYEIFPNKEQLIASCLQSLFDAHEISINKVIKEASSPVEALLEFIINGLEHYSNVPYGFFRDVKMQYPMLYRSAVVRKIVVYRQEMENLIAVGMEQGLFMSCISARKALALYGRSLFSIYTKANLSKTMQRTWLSMGVGHTFIYLRGICTVKGLQECDKLLEEARVEYIQKQNI